MSEIPSLGGGVRVIVSRWVPKDFCRLVDGNVIAGSKEIVDLMIDFMNRHRVLTSPACWVDYDGNLVDAMPEPMRPLP